MYQLNRLRSFCAALTLLVTAAAQAQQNKDVGVGVILAEPTGIGAKIWLDPAQAVDAAAAWTFSGSDSLQLHADWLLHRFDVFPGIDPYYGRLPLYFGLGARVLFNDDRHGHVDDDVLGVRVPVGVTYVFTRVPFDVFAEVVPILDVVPDSRLNLDAAIGGRFYFGRRSELLR